MSGEDDNKRSMFSRVFNTFLWFVLIFVGTRLVIGVNIAFENLRQKDLGHNLPIDFYEKYGVIITVLQIILILGLAIPGILGGTGKQKKKDQIISP